MDMDQSASLTSNPLPSNPHVLWCLLLGYVLWVGVLSFAAGGPFSAALCLILGGLTFADAWQSGVYKRSDTAWFLKIPPMAWGIAMALLFIVAYPAYVLNRSKLRTIQGPN